MTKQRLGYVLLTVALLGMLSPVRARVDGENPFGVIEGFWFPETTCELGVGWERIIFDWAQHQPTSPLDWHTLNVDDRWLKAANQCGREVVALLKNTPSWATEGIAGAGVPSGLTLPVDHPDNHWANFVRQTARYYAPRGVNTFIIWNEPDIAAGTYGYEFEGSVEDYAQLLKVASIAVRQGNPNAQIHLAGTTYWHNINEGERLYLDRLLELITSDPDAAANGHYFDALSLHIYFRTETVYSITREARALLDSYGLNDKAIWINETNAPPTQDEAWPVERPVYPYTLEQQAAFLTQAAALGLAAGAERIAVYKLFDQGLPLGGETFGILRPNDQSPRPAFDAWHTVIQRMQAVESANYISAEGVEAVWLEQANDQHTLVIWATGANGVELTVTGSGAVYHHLNGAEPMTTFEATPLNVSLAGALCNGHDPLEPCPVGGEPVLITFSSPATVQVSLENGTMQLLVNNGELFNE